MRHVGSRNLRSRFLHLLLLAGGTGLIFPAPASAGPVYSPPMRCDVGVFPPQATGGGISSQSYGICSGGPYARITTTLTLHGEDGSTVVTREGTNYVGFARETVVEVATTECVSGNYYSAGSAIILYPNGYSPQYTRASFSSGLAYVDCGQQPDSG